MSFSHYRTGLSGPGDGAVEVNLAADTTFPVPVRALYVGTGGDVVIVTGRGEQVTFRGVPSGSLLPVMAATVKSTANGTTASNIVGIY